MRRTLLCLAALAACGDRSRSTPARDDAPVAHAAATAPVEVDAQPLGLPELAAFGWRSRDGHAAFRTARAAEAVQDWPAVVAGCEEALEADPGHLEAAWLLAAALGRLRQHDALLAPLQRAVAGDFGKWGQPSLELPAFASFLATPLGAAWRARVERDRGAYIAALARSVIVTADGDLFAFDPEAARWHRLTRTSGAVIGALPVAAAHRIAYVTRQRTNTGKTLAVGLIDLARGRTSRPTALATLGPRTIAYSTQAPAGIWIGTPPRRGAGRGTWQRLDDAGKRVAVPGRARRPPGAWLEITGRTVRRRAPPLADVTADWDDHGLASALRVGRSKRIVAVPNPGLIHGSSAAWSPERARLAFVAQLSDECTPGALELAAFVADAATGRVQELERAARGIAVEWVSERQLAIAGDHGVALHDLEGAPSVVLDGADGLVRPRQRSSCAATEPEPELPDPVDVPPDDVEPPESGPGEAVDAAPRGSG